MAMTSSPSGSAGSVEGEADERPFDRDSLLIRLGGSREILVELASLFCVEARRMASELWERIERRDARAAIASAHQLKGALLNLSAEPAATTARELETCLRSGDWNSSLAAAQQLLSELELLVAALTREQSAA